MKNLAKKFKYIFMASGVAVALNIIFFQIGSSNKRPNLFDDADCQCGTTQTASQITKDDENALKSNIIRTPKTYNIRINVSISKVPSVSLYMRLTAKHSERFYCDFLRTMVLFWPPSYGKLVLVLDEESRLDHKLSISLKAQFDKYFPLYKIEIFYEPLPRNYKTLLKLPWGSAGIGYNRQIWSSFFNDLYTNDTIIAWVDSDTAFSFGVTHHSLYNGSRLRVIGTDCTIPKLRFGDQNLKTVKEFLGLPAVGDFMLHFPIYIYRETFANCRKYLLRKHGARDFAKIYQKISTRGKIFPVNIVLNYAWYFERDRYDWSFKICTSPLHEYNKRFQQNASISFEDIRPIIASPYLSVHTSQPNSALASAQLILTSYCLSNQKAGIKAKYCENKNDYTINNTLVLLKYPRTSETCIGNMTKVCVSILQRHYSLLGSEIFHKKRRMDWNDVEIIESLAKKQGKACPEIHNGHPEKAIPII